jgi:L-threonylcarbamoyladenylate synthase
MMPRVLSHDASETPSAVDAALETGQTLVFPTDTIYGIGGNPWDTGSLARVRALKGRPADQPFALLLPTRISIERYAVIDERLRRLIERLLPGPYTLLLPATRGAPPSSVRDGTIGIRVPDHPFFQRTLARLDRPLFGTSVNHHGEPALVDIDEIIDRFAAVDLVVTGPTGRSPSAILDLTRRPARLVRGELTRELQSILNEE